MGNCTSKKSEKLLKATSVKKPLHMKMERDQDNFNSKGSTKKIVPFTKGEVTSFGFKKKPNSSLPVPVTLTSNGNMTREMADKKLCNGILKNEVIEDCHSGSSVESLCHNAPPRLTSKMILKKDTSKQTVNQAAGNISNNNNNSESITKSSVSNNGKNNNYISTKVGFYTTNGSVNNAYTNSINQGNNMNNNHGNNTTTTAPPNRFGFRQQKPVRFSDPLKSETNMNNMGKRMVSNMGPYDTGTYKVTKRSESTRSRSEGPREAFFKQTVQPAGSMQSVVGQTKTNVSATPQPGKFTLQTSHLPRPQFPVRMPDTKTAKTFTNYYRRAGPQSDSNSSKEGSSNDDSGFETHSLTNKSKNDEGFDSPGLNVRRRLQTAHGKKLEMKIVGNKFELLDKAEEKDKNVVTEVSLIMLPVSGTKTSTAVINTGIVEQRTNQYLKKISECNKKTYNTQPRQNIKFRPNTRTQDYSSDSSHVDEGFGAESEEEKLFKDRNGSEKLSVNYLMNDGCGDEDLLPGEAMAEDISVSFSSDDETSAIDIRKKPSTAPAAIIESDITPNTIRLDALKLSKQLKSGKVFMADIGGRKNCVKLDESTLDIGSCDPDDETFPSESILEQLSFDSDSIGDKGENKIDNKKMQFKDLEEDIEIEELEDDSDAKKIDLKNIDLEISDLDLNTDEKELIEIHNNATESKTPDSPSTPTNASNSLSLSEGRDFLIDDEIADQPQLCLTETYPDCSCHEDVKTCNDKTVTSSCTNMVFVSCAEGGKTFYKNESIQAGSDSANEVVNIEEKYLVKEVCPAKIEKRKNSGGTLSPCDSLTSDDLMMDFESSVCDEASERINSINGCSNVDEAVKSKIDCMKEPLTNSSHKNTSGAGGCVQVKTRAVNSTPGSPKSCDSVPNGDPGHRGSRIADEDSVRIDKGSYENMFQDIAGIKKMLLKLRQVLSDAEGDGCENGMRSIGSENGGDCIDEMSDLRRQVIFLQQQLEERERTVQTLQMEIRKSQDGPKSNGTDETRERCNAATQTDRTRPVSTGPSILQSLPMDSNNLVSNHFTNCNMLNSMRNQARTRWELAHDDRNTKGFVAVNRSSHVEKIMEKVKELSFKPVEVLEKEEMEEEALKLSNRDPTAPKNARITGNGLVNPGNGVFSSFESRESDNPRKPSKNVFKITKIDLVLKSDNYGKNHMSQSNR